MQHRLVTAVLAVVVLVALFGPTGTSADGPGPPYALDTVVLRFRDAVPAADREAVLRREGMSRKRMIHGTDTMVLRAGGRPLEPLVAALDRDPLVEYAELDYRATAAFVPNDPEWPRQWGPQKVRAPAAWDRTLGTPDVAIAIVDTGIALDHPDLAAKVRPGRDFVNDDDVAEDDDGHGTHVAGIAAAITNNATGIAGMCPNCSLVPVKVLDASGAGPYSDIASGIRWAADQPNVRVINLSIGGPWPSSALRDALSYATSKGIVVTCAAGNSGSARPVFPAFYLSCIAVAATDQNDQRVRFSDFGPWIDTAAPGDAIVSTYLDRSYAVFSGTSMAAPHVAGLAGLLFSLGFSSSEVRTRLTSPPYTAQVQAVGIPRRIDAEAALR